MSSSSTSTPLFPLEKLTTMLRLSSSSLSSAVAAVRDEGVLMIIKDFFLPTALDPCLFDLEAETGTVRLVVDSSAMILGTSDFCWLLPL